MVELDFKNLKWRFTENDEYDREEDEEVEELKQIKNVVLLQSK